MRESDIERYLVAKVKALGGEVRKVKWIGRNGAPDRLVMVGTAKAVAKLADVIDAVRDDPGHRVNEGDLLLELIGMVSFWPELKAPGEKAKPHQVREHERMRRMGQRVEVIDSIEGVDRLLGGA